MIGRSQNDRHIELTAFELLNEFRAPAGLEPQRYFWKRSGRAGDGARNARIGQAMRQADTQHALRLGVSGERF